MINDTLFLRVIKTVKHLREYAVAGDLTILKAQKLFARAKGINATLVHHKYAISILDSGNQFMSNH